MSLLRIVWPKTLITNNLSALNRIICAYSTTKLQNVTTEIDKRKQTSEEIDEPVVYSKSPASQWQAKFSRVGTDAAERLWYEPHVVFISIVVFMLYFCVLREENSIDKEFNQTLYSRIKGLEEKQLVLLLKYNQEHGLEIKEIEDRLHELAVQNKDK